MKPFSRPSGVSNGGSTYARSVSGGKNNKEDPREARMDRLEAMLKEMMVSQRSSVAGSSGNQ